MSPIDPDQLLRHLRWRYATQRFDPTRKIGGREWEALEQSIILAPSSFGLQPWKFIVVTDPAVKERLSVASRNQPQPRECSHFVVFCVRREIESSFVDEYVASISATRNVPLESLAGLRTSILGKAERLAGQHELWTSRQAYIALGFLLESAALLAIDSCPMEGFDPAGFDEALNLRSRGLLPVVACALGYRAADDKYAARAKVRFAASAVVEHI